MDKKRLNRKNTLPDDNRDFNTEVSREISPEDQSPYQALGETTNNIIKGYNQELEKETEDTPKPSDNSSNR